MYDTQRGVMVSGPDKQISLLAQTWAVKSKVLTPKQGRKAITAALAMPDALMPGTPYGTHYLIEAMLLCDMKDEAKNYLMTYWGGMIQNGADTFWELYNPENPDESPYGGTIVNSYCHAWSCGPAYFLRKYFA